LSDWDFLADPPTVHPDSLCDREDLRLQLLGAGTWGSDL